MTKVSALLDQIDSHSILLPEFQRGYVWNRDQVRGLMRSLYLGYPVGSLLVWESESPLTDTRGSQSGSGVRSLLLDGQQRMTSLYGVARGAPPEFFEGDPSTITGLFFNVDEEVFEFYAPVKMEDDPSWVSVTEVMRDGLEPFIGRFVSDTAAASVRLSRLAKLQGILNTDFHLEKITGADKTMEIVVDIFNRVNSGGTKLSKGDLALAQITSRSVAARKTMRALIDTWAAAGYKFKLDWLLRNVTAIATGKAYFRDLESVSADRFEIALGKGKSSVGMLLDVIAGRLGLDHGSVLLGPAGFPVLARYLDQQGGVFPSHAEQDKALYWLVQAGIWGRYSGSTETALAQDLDALERRGLDGLIENLARSRGGMLHIAAHDFAGNSLGARFYPLLYMLTRVSEARDLVTGIPLHNSLLGKNSSLQVHHLFPKAQLYAMDPPTARGDVNAVANFAFLTQDSNLKIGKRLPEEYLPEYESKFPGVLASQWIPNDPGLWQLDRFLDFLEARRELLASAANEFLNSLLAGNAPSRELPRIELQDESAASDHEPGNDEFAAGLEELKNLGFVDPEIDVEVAHPETGEVIAVAEAYWPDGLQPGRGSPVLVDVDGDKASIATLESLGYVVYSTIEALVAFSRRESAQESGDQLYT